MSGQRSSVGLPDFMPVFDNTLRCAIDEWRRKREIKYSLFEVKPGHRCTNSSCSHRLPVLNMYGCAECGNYHFCRRKIITTEILKYGISHLSEGENVDAKLGIDRGMWCPVRYDESDHRFVCAISEEVIYEDSFTRDDGYSGSINHGDNNDDDDDGESNAHGFGIVSKYRFKDPSFFGRPSAKLGKSKGTGVHTATRQCDPEVISWMRQNEETAKTGTLSRDMPRDTSLEIHLSSVNHHHRFSIAIDQEQEKKYYSDYFSILDSFGELSLEPPLPHNVNEGVDVTDIYPSYVIVNSHSLVQTGKKIRTGQRSRRKRIVSKHDAMKIMVPMKLQSPIQGILLDALGRISREFRRISRDTGIFKLLTDEDGITENDHRILCNQYPSIAMAVMHVMFQYSDAIQLIVAKPEIFTHVPMPPRPPWVCPWENPVSFAVGMFSKPFDLIDATGKSIRLWEPSVILSKLLHSGSYDYLYPPASPKENSPSFNPISDVLYSREAHQLIPTKIWRASAYFNWYLRAIDMSPMVMRAEIKKNISLSVL